MDAWLAAIPADTFVDVLPLLRRTFSTYAAPERRAIGARARHLTGAGTAADIGVDDGDDFAGIDMARAERVLPVLRLLLGEPSDDAGEQ